MLVRGPCSACGGAAAWELSVMRQMQCVIRLLQSFLAAPTALQQLKKPQKHSWCLYKAHSLKPMKKDALRAKHSVLSGRWFAYLQRQQRCGSCRSPKSIPVASTKLTA